MTEYPLSLRPAGAAIAAVLALSSTSAFAQDIIAPPTMPAPAPAPTIAVPPMVVAPAAPAPVIVLPAQPAAPTVAETPVASTAVRATPQRPTAQRASTPRPSPAERTVASTPTRAVANAPAPVASTPEAGAAASPEAPAASDVEFASAQTAFPADATPELDAATDPDAGLDSGELGLIGGALAIGGIAAAALLARRRRRNEEPEQLGLMAAHRERASAPPVPERAAAPVDESQPTAPAAPAAFATKVSANRTSTIAAGDHVRRAEEGPTADNPFLTRKNRLRRARFLDAQTSRSNQTNAGSAVQSQAAPSAGDWLDSYRRQNRSVAGDRQAGTDADRLVPVEGR